ncbi:Hypothetical protein CpMEX1_0016 [Corynebacterium pseudotuberculosis]|nr:Hypothetical protein CpPAT10_0015 [Corynebacterium pseudotuberculosis PAT10]AEP69293.1 Hypothetical protein Cp4202_0014 [Corynebacterium pseudotuberculosis 42/02-A]AEX38491.1 Hypothetical protein Cp3995_0013 [Corynebacterium pseudotuberculosis 3/99-5]AFF21181.1 Hypothetical protein CpP54B96_0015 [Corynebacterium pseudotuberculosis P54B96]AFH50924.1 Hypothetical protein Cp267_0015 [Corynebacterium pseudotuberculosis 267]AIG06366.1 hypothetical protein CPTA_00537 [Corynebacterium pseudotuberc
MLHGMKKTTSKFLEVVFLHEIGFEGMGGGVDTLKTITPNYQDAAAEVQQPSLEKETGLWADAAHPTGTGMRGCPRLRGEACAAQAL